MSVPLLQIRDQIRDEEDRIGSLSDQMQQLLRHASGLITSVQEASGLDELRLQAEAPARFQRRHVRQRRRG